jgi:hypothetical protein
MSEKLILLSVCIAAVMTGLWILGHGIYCTIRDFRKK